MRSSDYTCSGRVCKSVVSVFVAEKGKVCFYGGYAKTLF